MTQPSDDHYDDDVQYHDTEPAGEEHDTHIEIPLNLTLLGERVGVRVGSLEGMQEALGELARWTELPVEKGEELKSVVEELTLPALFNFMATCHYDETMATSAQRVCRYYLSTLPSSVLLGPELSRYLLVGLESTQPQTISLALEQLLRLEVLQLDTMWEQVAHPIVRHLAASQLTIYKLTSQLILKVSSTPQFERFLNTSEVLPTLLHYLQNPTTTTVRVTELLLQVITTSESEVVGEDPVTLLSRMGLITPLISGLDTEDLLIKLNLLEVYSDFCHHPKILPLLNSNGVFHQVLASLRTITAPSDPATTLLHTTELTFLATCLPTHPDGDFADEVLDLMESFLKREDDADLQVAALTALPSVSQSDPGLTHLLKRTTLLSAIVTLFYHPTLSPLLPPATITCLAAMFDPRDHPTDLRHEFVHHLLQSLQDSGDLRSQLTKFATLPDPTPQVATYSLLHSLTAYPPVGPQFLLTSPAFLPTLLDRPPLSPLVQQHRITLVNALLPHLPPADQAHYQRYLTAPAAAVNRTGEAVPQVATLAPR